MRSLLVVAGLSLAFVLACGGVAAPAPRGLPAHAVRLEPAVIVDATGFERPMAAATIFLPQGWTTAGGVLWGAEALCTNGYQMKWSATAPDGLAAVAVLPAERWESSNYGAPPSTPGCQSAPWSSARQYLEALAGRAVPGARITGYRPREDVRKDFTSLEQTVPMPAGESRVWVEAGEVSFDYTEAGRPMRGTIAAVVVFNLLRANYGMGPMDALTGSSFPAWAAFAAPDRFDAALFEGLRRSIRPDPEWTRRINGHDAAIAKVALEESRKRSEMITKSNAEIAEIRQQAWSASQESADRRAREFGELLRGVETYADAGAPGGQVELSNQLGNAWRLDDGSYVLTDDAGFEPWRDLGVEGSRLEAVK